MSGSYQKWIGVGNLGKDPEMRFMPDGTAVTSFSIAVDREFTRKTGEKVKETGWFRISVFGKRAEACNDFLKKGSKVLVEGTFTPDENGGPAIWTDKSGKPRANFEVMATDVKFLSPGGTGSPRKEQEPEFD
jgi:single-strand DNA-binding protein